MSSLPQLSLDHIVYAVPDLERAVAQLEERLGVRASPGGEHRGLGTRNALLALQDEAYIEIIGPDPAQPEPQHPRPFGIDELAGPRVATWAARESQLEARIAAARAAGCDPGTVSDVSRATPAGETLSWRLSIAAVPGGDGLVPFLIDWGDATHPSASAAPGCSLVSMRGQHPNPEAVQRDLAALGAALAVDTAPTPALVIVLDTPKGRIEIR